MKKSEREAAARAQEILKRAGARGEEVGGEYGAGAMTKHQKASQAKHIPMKEGPTTTGAKIRRALWG